MTAPNVNTGPQYPHRVRPGWPIGAEPTSLELATGAARAVVEAMNRAPSSTPEEIARAYVAAKGQSAFQAFALALMDRAGLRK